MERLINFFDAVEPLSEESKKVLRNRLTIREVEKGMYYLEPRKVCNRIGFVIDGVFRVWYTDEEGTDRTRYFVSEGHFAVDINSFNQKEPTTDFIEPVTQCTVVEISMANYEYFCTHIPNFLSIIKKITERALMEKLKLSTEMVMDDAITRYQKLMNRHPHLINRVPLHLIASFLGVTPFTLSRIRSKYRYA